MFASAHTVLPFGIVYFILARSTHISTTYTTNEMPKLMNQA